MSRKQKENRNGRKSLFHFISGLLPNQGLNAAEKKQLMEDKRRLSGRTHEKPSTAQQTITFEKMYHDGICLVQKGFYTKMVEFFDINYDLLEVEDQGDILE